jgi:hypothetical protein
MTRHLNTLAVPDPEGLDQYDCWQRAEEAQGFAVALREQAGVYRAADKPGLETTIVTLNSLAAVVQARAHRWRQAAERAAQNP